MATTSPAPVLGDDHLDLLVSAAADWGLLAVDGRPFPPRTALQECLLRASAHAAGQQLRQENTAAALWLADHGRGSLVEVPDEDAAYTHRPVARIDPVEVIKAAHCAQQACRDSPTWEGGYPARLLAALITAATHRLPGYADAPWEWTRPVRRAGPSVGVALPGSAPPPVPGLLWVAPDAVREHWASAPLVVVPVAAAAAVPEDLPPRPGVLVLTVEGAEDPDQVWHAVTALGSAALVVMWPSGAPWLQQQLRDPAPEYVERRLP